MLFCYILCMCSPSTPGTEGKIKIAVAIQIIIEYVSENYN